MNSSRLPTVIFNFHLAAGIEIQRETHLCESLRRPVEWRTVGSNQGRTKNSLDSAIQHDLSINPGKNGAANICLKRNKNSDVEIWMNNHKTLPLHCFFMYEENSTLVHCVVTASCVSDLQESYGKITLVFSYRGTAVTDRGIGFLYPSQSPSPRLSITASYVQYIYIIYNIVGSSLRLSKR